MYVGVKQRASAEVGTRGFDHRLPQDTPHEEVEALLRELNANPEVSGIVLQLPTPPQVEGPGADHADRPRRGRRRVTPVSAGRLMQHKPGLRPCTPAA